MRFIFFKWRTSFSNNSKIEKIHSKTLKYFLFQKEDNNSLKCLHLSYVLLLSLLVVIICLLVCFCFMLCSFGFFFWKVSIKRFVWKTKFKSEYFNKCSGQVFDYTGSTGHDSRAVGKSVRLACGRLGVRIPAKIDLSGLNR